MPDRRRPTETYGCATCASPLTIVTTRDDSAWAYVHPHTAADDHPTVPVPLSHLSTVNMRCDFCSAPNPVAVFTFSPLEIEAIADNGSAMATHNLGGDWSACQDCSTLVQRRDPEALTQRATHLANAHDATTTAAMLRPLHQALFAATPTTPILRPLDRPTRTAAPEPIDASPTRHLRPRQLPKVRDRLARFWRTTGQAYLLNLLTYGRTYDIPGHLHPGAPLDAPATPIDAATPDLMRAYTALMANHLDTGHLFWVDAEFSALAAHAARDLPDVRISPAEMPATGGMLIWQSPILRSTEPTTGVSVPVIAAQWGPIPGGVWVTFYTTAETLHEPRKLTERGLQDLRERVGWLAPVNTGSTLHFEQTHAPATDDIRTMLSCLIATWILTTQPDAELVDEPADKAIRKAYQRANRPSPAIRLVRLRRKNQAPSDTTAGATARVYTRRWWVRGFFRDQPYGPGRTQRKRTYVRPHVKGPADAPLILTEQVRVLGEPPRQAHE
ncbi:hypothetical protein [Micromonospora sp. SH-82]|uniref:hypothetical protein n=1 Tax=Micromonospora sp. SH-82 TaxID=3132938 RepID=UPI003EBCC0D9